jgi:PhnB protein
MTEPTTDHIPAGSHAVTPYLCCRGAAEAIDFYVTVLGATEEGDRFVDADGKVGHAELRFGDSLVMLADEFPGYGISPVDLPDSPVAISLYVPDVDAVVAKAVEAGAKILTPLEETFYGVRRAALRDPFGHRWLVGTQVRVATPDEYAQAREDYAQATTT